MLKYTNSKAFLKILWTNEDKSRTATFVIHKELSETEQVQELLKAVGFLATTTGVIPPSPPIHPVPTGATATTTPSATSAKTVESAAVPPGPTTPPGSRVQMMPPASLSDLPAGGLPPKAQKDLNWEDMPTTTVPAHLAQAWETIPPDEQGTW